MKKLVMLLALFSMGQVFAQSKAKFCKERKKKTFSKNVLSKVEARLSFKNQGGLLEGGVCWWHSRFQRNASYLVRFNPKKAKPSTAQALKIIKAIKEGKRVVTINGYNNMNRFSWDYYNEIQDVLERWQRTDGILKFKWVVGASGDYRTTASKLKKSMQKLYKYVSQGNIAYQKLQLKGIIAHAWLVTDMKKIKNGYVLTVIDSNKPTTSQNYYYYYGMTSFRYPYYGDFIPHTHEKQELVRIKKTIRKYCR